MGDTTLVPRALATSEWIGGSGVGCSRGPSLPSPSAGARAVQGGAAAESLTAPVATTARTGGPPGTPLGDALILRPSLVAGPGWSEWRTRRPSRETIQTPRRDLQ
jgi:hypothetical protein